jgi:hypothetical protein
MNTNRPDSFEDRYRLYLDESGDHVFREVSELPHRFLCLLGCWFKNSEYLIFHQELEALKSRHLPHHPDDPVIFHREDMINARKAFKALRDKSIRESFNNDLLTIISKSSFKVVAVIIDKESLRAAYSDASAHPYHLGLGFLLQRFAGYLNHINRVGDVMAEARGGVEDRLLSESYTRVYEHGVWSTDSNYFQSALSSRQLKLKPKVKNIAGLQLADLLGHPVKQWVLKQNGFLMEELAPFAQLLMKVIEEKFNRHLYYGRIEGYGWVLYPKK